MHDVRLAVRSLLRQPGFSILAVLIVALGAGANAAVFSVVHAVLLRPLPYAEPDRLVAVGPTFFSAADIEFLRARARAFEDLATSSPGWMMSMVGVGDPVQIVAARPSPNLFRMLRLEPLGGRLFYPEDVAGGRHRVVVLGYALWQRRFGGDPAAIGRIITLDGAAYEIIGVLSKPSAVIDIAADAWVPFDPGSSFARARNTLAYGRLRSGVSPESASRELQALLPELRRETQLSDSVQTLHATPLQQAIVGDVQTPLLLVATAVGLLIVLTAANLGTLLLGREVARRRDAAVRAALGASRLRLARQTIVDNVTLAVLGALAGAVMARLALPSLVAVLPRDIPRLAEVAIDPVVMAVVLLVTVGAVLSFGVLPSLLAAPVTLQPLLREGAQTDARGTRRTLDLLVVAQLGLAVVLGVGAALMVRSLWALRQVNPGFSPDTVLTLRLQPAGERYRGTARTLTYYRTVAERVAAVPGVQTVGFINHLPLSGYNWVMGVRADDQPSASAGSLPRIGWRMIDGNYFSAMGIPFRGGRLFAVTDDAAATRVVIVNEAAARRFFGSPEKAIGRTIWTAGPTGEQRAEIVGVVGDVRHTSIARAPEPEFYTPAAQMFGMAMTLVVRTTTPPASLGAAVRSAVWSVDPNIAIAGMGTLTTMVRENLDRPRMLATLLFVFAAVGLVIVLCGVYGVVGYSVRRRERELGIRMALGAGRSSIGRLVLRQGIAYAVFGLIIGAPAALAVSRLMRGVLFGVQPWDPATLGVLCGLVAVTTVGATLVPAWRAQRIEPIAVLKSH